MQTENSFIMAGRRSRLPVGEVKPLDSSSVKVSSLISPKLYGKGHDEADRQSKRSNLNEEAREDSLVEGIKSITLPLSRIPKVHFGTHTVVPLTKHSNINTPGQVYQQNVRRSETSLPELDRKWALEKCEELTKWVCDLLESVGKTMEYDLRKSIMNGDALVHVISALYNHSVARESSSADTVRGCIRFLVSVGCVVDSPAEDIIKGDLRSIIKLLTAIKQSAMGQARSKEAINSSHCSDLNKTEKLEPAIMSADAPLLPPTKQGVPLKHQKKCKQTVNQDHKKNGVIPPDKAVIVAQETMHTNSSECHTGIGINVDSGEKEYDDLTFEAKMSQASLIPKSYSLSPRGPPSGESNPTTPISVEKNGAYDKVINTFNTIEKDKHKSIARSQVIPPMKRSTGNLSIDTGSKSTHLQEASQSYHRRPSLSTRRLPYQRDLTNHITDADSSTKGSHLPKYKPPEHPRVLRPPENCEELSVSNTDEGNLKRSDSIRQIFGSSKVIDCPTQVTARSKDVPRATLVTDKINQTAMDSGLNNQKVSESKKAFSHDNQEVKNAAPYELYSHVTSHNELSYTPRSQKSATHGERQTTPTAQRNAIASNNMYSKSPRPQSMYNFHFSKQKNQSEDKSHSQNEQKLFMPFATEPQKENYEDANRCGTPSIAALTDYTDLESMSEVQITGKFTRCASVNDKLLFTGVDNETIASESVDCEEYFIDMSSEDDDKASEALEDFGIRPSQKYSRPNKKSLNKRPLLAGADQPVETKLVAIEKQLNGLMDYLSVNGMMHRRDNRLSMTDSVISNQSNYTMKSSKSYRTARAGEHRSMKKKLQRLESHLVTLARSLSHIASEVRAQNNLHVKLSKLTEEVENLKLSKITDQLGCGSRCFTNEINGYASENVKQDNRDNAHKLSKLTRFFGQEPPVLKMFLKQLGYEQYAGILEEERIGMLELPYMTEEKMRSIGIPLGPRTRILEEASTLKLTMPRLQYEIKRDRRPEKLRK